MITTQPIKFDRNNTSNFKSQFNFVVQANNTFMGWVDSKFGGHTIQQAIDEAKKIDCMTETTVLRVVKSK